MDKKQAAFVHRCSVGDNDDPRLSAVVELTQCAIQADRANAVGISHLIYSLAPEKRHAILQRLPELRSEAVMQQLEQLGLHDKIAREISINAAQAACPMPPDAAKSIVIDAAARGEGFAPLTAEGNPGCAGVRMFDIVSTETGDGTVLVEQHDGRRFPIRGAISILISAQILPLLMFRL
jgi:hypothetical protein